MTETGQVVGAAGLDTDAMYAHLEEDEAAALPPEDPSVPPGEWIQKNLFSSIPNGMLTVVFGVLSIAVLRGLLQFVLSDERQWDAVATNMRLLFAQGYPLDQFVRIWVSLGIFMALAGLSMAIYRASGSLSMKRIAIWVMNAGAFAVVIGLLSPLSGGGRAGWLIGGVVVGGIGAGIWYGLGEVKRRSTFVPSVWFAFGFLGLLIGSLWVVPYGHYTTADGSAIAITGRTVAFSTKMPWTVMLLLLVGSYVIGVAVRDRLSSAAKPALAALWLLSPFIVTWIVLRDPDFDYNRVFSTDLPMALGFGLLGGALLYFLTKSNLGETARLIALAVLAFAIFNWVAAFFGWYPMLQKARISFLLLGVAALMAPSFAGETKKRLRFLYMWIGFIAVTHWLITAINSDSTLNIQADTFFGGMTLTIFVATLTMLFSFPLGVMLALARTSTLPIFRVLSTIYIEAVRGVPLITILFFFSTILPLFLPAGMNITELAAIIVGYTLFSAAYAAENIRGGLQSIRRGQYEAADALGLNTAQRTGFVVMPQALRVSIPPLVGSAIGTFKETSLVAIIGSFDLLLIANRTIGAQTDFLGVKREGLLFVSAVYWVVAFSMSKYSQRLERKLGVGER